MPGDPSRVHYPQDDSPLCCCEYFDRHGNRNHVLGLLCACDDLDGAADSLLRGSAPGRDQIDQILAEIDDRLRVPFPGGAWHVGVSGSVPWFLLPFMLIIGGLSLRCLVIVGALMIPSLLWWHRRALKMRKRTSFLYAWMLASLSFESLLYYFALARQRPSWHDTSTMAFGIPLLSTIIFLLLVKRADPSSCAGVADAESATARSVRCAVSGIKVPRYDHYCAWVDEPVGSSNHRAYILFVWSMLCTCLIGAYQMYDANQIRFGWTWSVAWATNGSTMLVSFALYGIAVGLAVMALLVHQVMVIVSGSTAYEARRKVAPASGGLWEHVQSFERQTATLSATVVAAWVGRKEIVEEEGGSEGDALPLVDGGVKAT